MAVTRRLLFTRLQLTPVVIGMVAVTSIREYARTLS
jgi:hypothetical protein